MFEVIPGILEQDWQEIERKLAIIKPFSKTVHIDLLDGKFAPNTTFFDPEPFTKYSKDFLLELHMMVDDPLQYVDSWAEAGFRRFIGQIEMMPDQEAFVKKVRNRNCEAGLAIDSPTPVEAIVPAYNSLDFVFVMTVKAGFSNQSFLSESLGKVQLLRTKTDKPIEVDGGISDKTIKEAHVAGATRFVSTGFLFGQGDIANNYQTLMHNCTKPSA